MRRFKVIATGEEILTKALHSDIDDFEDAVIEVSSKENDAEYILTRNAKDFKKSIVKAITPDELLVILRMAFQKKVKNINEIRAVLRITGLLALGSCLRSSLRVSRRLGPRLAFRTGRSMPFFPYPKQCSVEPALFGYQLLRRIADIFIESA
jgi:hypothetical protein